MQGRADMDNYMYQRGGARLYTFNTGYKSYKIVTSCSTSFCESPYSLPTVDGAAVLA